MMLTVFTPAYNRAHLLVGLYKSFLNQNNRDFEWLVVDDGSVDETEAVVQQMIAEGIIRIKYHKKVNGGKHTAHNEALKLASGEWFMCVDSDDMLAENAMDHLAEMLQNASGNSTVFVAHKSLKDGTRLGGNFPVNMGTETGMYALARRGARGEYVLVFKTSVIREYPYPVITGERFMGENVLYDRLELNGHTVQTIDRVLQVCEYQPDGLSAGAYRLLVQNPTGYQIYHAQRIDLVATMKERIRHCICYQAFYRMSRNKQYAYCGRWKWLTMLTWLPGVAASWYYRVKGK